MNMNESFYEILISPTARKLLGHDAFPDTDGPPFTSGVLARLDFLLRNASNLVPIQDIGQAALNAFLQANVTGPCLPFPSDRVLIPQPYHKDDSGKSVQLLRKELAQSLIVDGVAIYQLTPNIELFWLASRIANHESTITTASSRLQRARVNFLHQRMLTENSDSLQSLIYEDLEYVERVFAADTPLRDGLSLDITRFLLERAVVHIHHGQDVKARADLETAARKRGFEFVLTGRKGKRTKFQDRDISQLVVLAKSVAQTPENANIQENGSHVDVSMPQNLDLNDDTLLERMSFAKSPRDEDNNSSRDDDAEMTPILASLDPSNQPLLDPLDSIILLNFASSIQNTNPQDGLTREETLPYATRALEGGSSNWQVYTQALLVRSRIEGYRSRTVERGVLQLQALVDQVIAETTSHEKCVSEKDKEQQTSKFLPQPKASESAPVSERLEYIWQLNSPTRWELEAELAARWVSLGGLRTALEIYERLQMWAEVALCLAATDQEGQAEQVVRKQLYQTSENGNVVERRPLPADAPRLFCLLGDLLKDPTMYERAWEVSNRKYARAQRSLGKHHVQSKEYSKAAEAYGKSLAVNRLNHATWFALGCIELELEEWPKAVESFTHTVQLQSDDAEAWSNLAAALLQLPARTSEGSAADDDSKPVDPQKPKKDALLALRRAAQLKHTDSRIWANYLAVSASIAPPPYADIILAQKRIIDIRGTTVGEKCIDVPILTLLVDDVVATEYDGQSSLARGTVAKQVVELLDKDVMPLITASAPLWQVVAKLNAWRQRPMAALEAHEKAWRAVTSQPGAYEATEKKWNRVVDATIGLVNAYEELGMRQRERTGGEVAKDWNFKARSAVRGVMGKGKESWEDTDGWERLKEAEARLNASKG